MRLENKNIQMKVRVYKTKCQNKTVTSKYNNNSEKNSKIQSPVIKECLPLQSADCKAWRMGDSLKELLVTKPGPH